MSDEHPTPPPPPPSAPPPPPPASPPPPPAHSPAPPPAGGSGNRKVMLVLSYLGILALIPFLLEKDDKEVRWHAKHGLVLFGAYILIWIALMIVLTLFETVIGSFGCISLMIYPLISLAFFVLSIACIVQALAGKRLLIPGISEFADKF